MEPRSSADDGRLSSPSTARNRDPILAVLTRVLPEHAKVLEIASGAGEHAVYFAKARPDLDWSTSDVDPAAHASIAAWIAHEGVRNVAAPVVVDARDPHWGVVETEAPFDAVVSINMIHIAPWEACLGLLDGAARLLGPHGVLFLYGPFARGGVHAAPSNEAFDASLKSRDPSWGVRDLDVVAKEADARGLALQEVVPMPANNLSVVFRRR